jgi:hypothetical protein
MLSDALETFLSDRLLGQGFTLTFAALQWFHDYKLQDYMT